MPGRNPPTHFFRPKLTGFHQIWREKKRKTVTQYGHNSWSRNRCWAYNVPNRSTFRALQICQDEIPQLNFLGQNSLVFIRFGGKKMEKLWLNTGISLDPEIVVGPIIYQIKALLKPYKSGGADPTSPFLRPKFTCFDQFWRKKSKNRDWIRP